MYLMVPLNRSEMQIERRILPTRPGAKVASRRGCGRAEQTRDRRKIQPVIGESETGRRKMRMTDNEMRGASLVDAAVLDSVFGVGGSPFYEKLYGRLIYAIRAAAAEVSAEELPLGHVAAFVADEKRLDELMAAEPRSDAGRSARQWYTQVWLALQPALRSSVVHAFKIVETGRFMIESVDGGEAVKLGERKGPWSGWSLRPFPEHVRTVADAVARGEHTGADGSVNAQKAIDADGIRGPRYGIHHRQQKMAATDSGQHGEAGTEKPDPAAHGIAADRPGRTRRTPQQDGDRPELKTIIETRLDELHMTARAAERHAGVPPETIRSVLRGRSPSYEKLLRICDALDLQLTIRPKDSAERQEAPAPTAKNSGTPTPPDQRQAARAAVSTAYYADASRADVVAELQGMDEEVIAEVIDEMIKANAHEDADELREMACDAGHSIW